MSCTSNISQKKKYGEKKLVQLHWQGKKKSSSESSLMGIWSRLIKSRGTDPKKHSRDARSGSPGTWRTGWKWAWVSILRIDHTAITSLSSISRESSPLRTWARSVPPRRRGNVARSFHLQKLFFFVQFLNYLKEKLCSNFSSLSQCCRRWKRRRREKQEEAVFWAPALLFSSQPCHKLGICTHSLASELRLQILKWLIRPSQSRAPI